MMRFLKNTVKSMGLLTMYKVVVTSLADWDLDEIFEYIAIDLDSPKAAADMVTHLYDSAKSLSNYPLRHPLVRDDYLAMQGFRYMAVKNYVVFYVFNEISKQAIIHRVLHSRQSYKRLLRS